MPQVSPSHQRNRLFLVPVIRKPTEVMAVVLGRTCFSSQLGLSFKFSPLHLSHTLGFYCHFPNRPDTALRGLVHHVRGGPGAGFQTQGSRVYQEPGEYREAVFFLEHFNTQH